MPILFLSITFLINKVTNLKIKKDVKKNRQLLLTGGFFIYNKLLKQLFEVSQKLYQINKKQLQSTKTIYV